MSYETILKNAQTIQITEDIYTPPNYKGATNFIIPDQIVSYCIRQYELLNENVCVLDPMCGIGTIPRVINEKGGHCIGIEIDESRFKTALTVSDNNKIQQGSYLDIALAARGFHCIFTSMPFDWFKLNAAPTHPDYAEKFKELLDEDGFILLDSVPLVRRAGEEWPVASRQCDYLEKNGFSLVEVTRFQSELENVGESVIMKFIPCD